MTDHVVQPTGTARTGQAPPGGGSDFVGRSRELKELRADMSRAGLHTLSGHPSPHTRVLLIAGQPGSGRTALAEEFVQQVAGRYPDGVLRARLTDPGGGSVPVERSARDLLAALGGAPAPAGADEDELTGLLRAALARRRVLLLLDDVAGPEQVLDLLPDNRECLVVAVASGPLVGVPDVRPCTLGGLDRASAIGLLGRQGPSELRITVDPCSAEALAQECGDLPAALLLVGGWLAARPKISVADAVSRLAATPGKDPLERAFRLVHDSLGKSAQRMLRLLAMAPAGTADEQTASALAGISGTASRAMLDEFVALGLLREAHPQRYDVPRCFDPVLRALLAEHERPADAMLCRARMLERTVRQLRAAQMVSEPEGSQARLRHGCLPRPLRFRDAAEAGEWLEARRPALLAAARIAVSDSGGQLDTLARRLVSALARAFEAHRSPEEAAPELYRLHELILGVFERSGRGREQAAVLLDLGDLDTAAGRHPVALTRYRTALEAARGGGDHSPVTGRALESIGGAYAGIGDWERAADWYGRALEFHQERGDAAPAARLHSRIGAVHTCAGRYDDALREWRFAAAACRRLRDVRAHARALGETARVLEYAGRADESLRTYRQAIELARGTGDGPLQAALWLGLADSGERAGEAAAARIQRAEARRLLGTSDGLAEEPADVTGGADGSVFPGWKTPVQVASPEARRH